MLDRDRCLAFDCEFTNQKIPFIATSCDWRLDAELYNCHKEKEVSKLKAFLEDPSITKIAFPYTVDAHVVKALGIRCRGPFEDPLIAGTLLDENFAQRKGLKPMAKRYLNAEIKEARKLSKYKSKYRKKAKKLGIEFDYSQIPRFVMKPYATEDAIFTEKLWYLFREPIKKFQRLYDVEKKVAQVILKIQETRIMVDRKFVKKQAKQYGIDAEQCYANIQALLKQHHIRMPEFNPSSPKQVAYVMKRMGVPLPENERGHPITEAKVLAKFDKHQIVALQLLYRFLTKQKGTYFDPLWQRYTSREDPYACFFIFGSGARTGRMSAELIQTIPRPDESRTAKAPKLARMAFVPRPGYFMLAVDYKALQMMIFFHFANATKLIKKCIDGWDPHDAACEMLFGRVEKELRKMTKNIQFGLVFGMGLNKLLVSLQNSGEKKEMSRLEASQILDKYYEQVPVKEFTRTCVSQLHKTGILELAFESELMEFNREYRVPQELAYKGPNVLIQGCLDGNSRIYTKEFGYTTLRQVVGKKLRVWDGDQFSSAMCLPAGKKQKVIVTLINGQKIICSPTHKFLRVRSNIEWVEARLLKKGYQLLLTKPVVQNTFESRAYVQKVVNEDVENKRKKYVGKQLSGGSNRKTIRLDTITDFEFGVLVGRYASDGVQSDKGCSWLIAEHEESILPWMKKNVAKISRSLVRSKAVRENRMQRITSVRLHCGAFGKFMKICKNEIPHWIMNNGEVLRGYLCGMFDGDGSVGKRNGVVSLTLGGKTTWKWMHQIQEALLFFGIHSRLHQYGKKNKFFRLQIRTHDGWIFKEKIGFLNKKKQQRIRGNECGKEFEYRGVHVKSVEITDEKIEMYDIANSASGKYVANGIITHNTEAYVMKHAMLRVDRMIRKKGMDVNILSQVHDELLFEVSEKEPAHKVVKEICQSMEDHVTLKLPLRVEPKASKKNWGSVEEWSKVKHQYSHRLQVAV